ncbi:MAG: class I SAM-dependent methyltransferase [Gammaproteobacteria bacterium]|nr:class I SAM-dependent methyltransferase [Gammaproteobacteria bacterium]
MRVTHKPYSESCDQNQTPILEVIQPVLANCRQVLEIGSGTGQHAVAFARAMPQLTWHTSDCPENHPGIHLWLEEAGLENISLPIALDVLQDDWPGYAVDAIFTANTAHIMHWPEVEAMFMGGGKMLNEGGHFLMYGPFNYNGQFTSESNAQFDLWLKARDPLSGIRHFEEIDGQANKAGMSLKNDFTMPANNRILHWIKS